MQGYAPPVKLQMSIAIKIQKETRPNFTYKVLLTQLTSTPNVVNISSLLTEIWPVAIFDQPVPLKVLYTHISYYDDDYDNEDSIVSDVEVEPVINLDNNQPQRDDLEEISASGHVWHDEEIASVPERPDQMTR